MEDFLILKKELCIRLRCKSGRNGSTKANHTSFKKSPCGFCRRRALPAFEFGHKSPRVVFSPAPTFPLLFSDAVSYAEKYSVCARK